MQLAISSSTHYHVCEMYNHSDQESKGETSEPPFPSSVLIFCLTIIRDIKWICKHIQTVVENVQKYLLISHKLLKKGKKRKEKAIYLAIKRSKIFEELVKSPKVDYLFNLLSIFL